MRDRKTNSILFIYSHSSPNPVKAANLVKIGLLDVEIIGLTDQKHGQNIRRLRLFAQPGLANKA